MLETIKIEINVALGPHTSTIETGGVRRAFRKGDVTPNLSQQLATSSLKNAAALETQDSHKNYAELSWKLFSQHESSREGAS